MKAAIVSTYPPRACGLATFTTDLRHALLEADRTTEVMVAAVLDDGPAPTAPEVAVTLRQHERADYERAAAELTRAGADVVLVQHEFGIFGGDDGAYVLDLVRHLTVPYVVTLHTVLSRPSPQQAEVLGTLAAGAAEVTVFTATARDTLLAGGHARRDRVTVVSHGAPATLLRPRMADPAGPAGARGAAGLPELEQHGDRRVLSTFGLLSAGKGIEVALHALPAVVRSHPDVLYVVAGRTHPEVARLHGETYRRELERLTVALGLEDHVLFLDRYLSDDDLHGLLTGTTLFLTPYRSPEQVVSGVLTFAVVAGCPVVSTPYSYARDLLSGGAGRLVPFDDHAAMSEAVLALLGDDEALAAAANAAHTLGTQFTWPAVGRETLKLLHNATERREDHRSRPLTAHHPGTAPPPLTHLRRLVRAGGIVQHARGLEPDLTTGSCVDDVARLLVVADGLVTRHPHPDGLEDMSEEALAFLEDAWDAGTASMRNFRAADGAWLDAPHEGDHLGRAVWALGEVGGGPTRAARRSRTLVRRVLDAGPAFPAPRSTAFAVLGLARLPAARHLAPEVEHLDRLAHGLLARLDRRPDPRWHWFEDQLTYDNARLPQALLAAGARLAHPDLLSGGLESLEWYVRQVGLDTGPVVLVGHRWRRRPDGPPDPGDDEGDEQPLDAAALVEACVEAHRVTRSPQWARRAIEAFAWFHGRNRWGAVVHDPASGGCHDGVGPAGLNANEGAESTLAYLQAWLALEGAGLHPGGPDGPD